MINRKCTQTSLLNKVCLLSVYVLLSINVSVKSHVTSDEYETWSCLPDKPEWKNNAGAKHKYAFK